MAAPETVGDRVRRYRRLRKLTQDQLADRSDVDRRQIGRLEAGEVLEPAAETVRRLATAMGIPIRALAEPLGWYSDEPAPADFQEAAESAIVGSDLSDEKKRAALEVIRALFTSGGTKPD